MNRRRTLDDGRWNLAAWIIAVVVLYSVPSNATEQMLEFGRFGRMAVYKDVPHPSRVVLLVSGDGGWKLGVVGMAKQLSALDSLVVGIDIRQYLRSLRTSKDACVYPAADFEQLSKFIQKTYDFPHYVLPLLMGYSSGATLVYATLVQAPPNTFVGAISLGFCPDLDLSKPVCTGYGLQDTPGPGGQGVVFLPATGLQTPWIALQGQTDQVCDASATEAYVKQVPRGELVLLPKVGHGYSVTRNWWPQFVAALSHIYEEHEQRTTTQKPALEEDVRGLPLVEVRAKPDTSDTLAVILTGDGGWASLDRDIGTTLAEKGISVVGFDSLQYFWTKRTPEIAAADLQCVILHYLKSWKKEKVILIGYSLGADVLPFLTSRASQEVQSHIKLVALLAPSQSVDFEFHLSDWLGSVSHGTERPILPEIEKLRDIRILCLYSDEDEDSVCDKIKPELATAVPLHGGHHLGGDYEELANRILKAAQ